MTNPTGLSASPRRRGAHWRAITIGAFALPPIFDLLLSDKRASFHYLAADSFYYLTVARNLVELGSPTFDEVHLTNGFHPLWQALLSLPSVLQIREASIIVSRSPLRIMV